MANAIKSQGFRFAIGAGGSPYTDISEVVSFTMLDGDAAEIDVSHLQSAAKEFLIGLKDNGNCTLELNYNPDDAGQVAVRAAVGGNIQDFRATFSSGDIATFHGFIKSAPLSGGVDEKVATTFNIRISGAVTWS